MSITGCNNFCPLTSKSPPSCGVVSSTTSFIVPAPIPAAVGGVYVNTPVVLSYAIAPSPDAVPSAPTLKLVKSATVPVASGRVIVLSCVGLVAVTVVSNPLSELPSNSMVEPFRYIPVAVVSNTGSLLKYIVCPAPALVCILVLLPAAF